MNQKGFTLVEIIVSLAIFSIVAIVAVGALVRVVSANRQAQAIQSSVNNISFILESMTREMRVGANYSCGSGVSFNPTTNNVTNTAGACRGALVSDSSGDIVVAFNSSNTATNPYNLATNKCNLIYAYKFTQKAGGLFDIEKAQQTSCLADIGGTDAQYFPILASSTSLTRYSVGVFKDNNAPYMWAFVRLTGHGGTRIQDQSRFDVQTSVSQRAGVSQ